MKKSLSHTLWECKYHVVWVPKRRRRIIFGRLRQEIGVILRRLCEYKGVDLLEGKACVDHIHMCIAIPPKYSVSTIVGYLKGKSAIIVFEKYSSLKKNFKGHSFWARGCYVSTVGLDEARVRKSIQDQEETEAIQDHYDSDLGNPFKGSQLEGFHFPNITKIDHHNIRQSASLLSRCDLLIAPDSSFIHFAAALEVPTLVLTGPIDGGVRTMDYPLAEYLVRMSVNAKASEVLALAVPVMGRIERGYERTTVEDLITISCKAQPTAGKAVLGLNAVLDAVNQGRVYRLIYPSGLKIKGYQCPSCNVLLDQAPGGSKCPYCSNRLEDVEDMTWLVSERVLHMGGRIEEIRGDESCATLDAAGGIGAFLR